ncbi:hypothetical protein GQ473_06315, partial [archaeon]|nr:hypothetical protein [archaeon]
YKTIFDTTINSTLASAIVILIVGFIVSRIFSDVIRRLLVLSNIDTYLTHVGFRRILTAIGYNGSLSEIIADIIKWLSYVVVLFSAAYVFGYFNVMIFLKYTIEYITKILIVLGVITVGIMIGDYFKKGIINILRTDQAKRQDVLGSDLPTYRVAGVIAKYFVIFLSILLSLAIIGIGITIIYIILNAFLLGIILIIALSLKDILKSIIISIYFQLSKVLVDNQDVRVDNVHGKIISVGPIYTKLKEKGEIILIPNQILVKKIIKIKD